jgi:hypothetical protein
MVVRTRSNCGKFVSVKKREDTEDIMEVEIMKRSKRWVYKIFLLLTFFIVVSPWMFLVFKNNSLTHISRRITEFYDENFSCRAYREELNNTEFSSINDIRIKQF